MRRVPGCLALRERWHALVTERAFDKVIFAVASYIASQLYSLTRVILLRSYIRLCRNFPVARMFVAKPLALKQILRYCGRVS